VLDLYKTDEISDQAVWTDRAAADLYITASYKTITDISKERTVVSWIGKLRRR
jgi:hypothetical protein